MFFGHFLRRYSQINVRQNSQHMNTFSLGVSHMSTIVTHMVGRPADTIMAFCAEKCNCTQIASMVFDAIGHGEKRRAFKWVHDYRWGPYHRSNPPPNIDSVRRAKANGTVCLKFVRDPVDRFASMYKRYQKVGIRGAPSGFSVDEFLDWVSARNVYRYFPGSLVNDDHILSQSFYEETDDLWTEIIHVETFKDPCVREHIRDAYGLIVDPEWTSDHWVPEPVMLTPEQRERVLQIYHMDRKYTFLSIRKENGDAGHGSDTANREHTVHDEPAVSTHP